MNNLRCPQCGLSHIKRNGYTHYGKQNYRCKDCDRQFVEESQHIGEEMKDLIKALLLERLSLRGICRVTGVSLTWLLDFITELYVALPDNLNVTFSRAQKSVIQLSFSKTIKNHIGAIKNFICHYNKAVIGFAESALYL